MTNGQRKILWIGILIVSPFATLTLTMVCIRLLSGGDALTNLLILISTQIAFVVWSLYVRAGMRSREEGTQ